MGEGESLGNRILAGIIICLGIAVAIAWFEGLGLGTEEINQAFENPDLITSLSESTFGYLLVPYSLLSATGAVVPIFAWGTGGFIGGLITKRPDKGLLVGLVSVGIAWIVFSFLSGVLAGFSFKKSISVLANQAGGLEKDLITACLAAAVPAALGGIITRERKIEIQPVDRLRE